MFNKSHLVGALFALIVIDDISIRIKAHKAGELYIEAQEIFEREAAAKHHQIMHLCRLIDNSGIEVDEFDMIVINNFPYEE